MTSYLLRRASTAPGILTDLAVADGTMVSAPAPHARVIDLEGRPTLPGLADHHIHLMAQAAAWRSVDCNPSALDIGGGLTPVLRSARRTRPSGWLPRRRL